jgi:putative heme-binding domain-containing protein
MPRALFLSALLLATGLSAQLANKPPAPLWLSGSSLEKTFTPPGQLLMAILLVASDAETTLSLNGQSIATLPPSPTATSLDLTRHLIDGPNTLSLRSSGKVAALLELNGDLARKSWIATDTTWTGPKLKSLGPTDADPATDPFDLKKTHDAYNSWKLAGRDAQHQATDPTTIQVPPGYQIQLVHSATPDQDSWVSMAFDPTGRLILGMEKKGLLRLSFSNPDHPEVSDAHLIDTTLEECRGLLHHDGWLYANANRSKALYRLRDANDDGTFEEKHELLRTGGSTGHGRNHLKLGPDGRLWIAHGNNVLLPENLSPNSPFKHYANDQLLPNPWDKSMFDGDVELPAGHILSMKPDGSDIQLIAAGLRNPLDLAFNRNGDLFTFDADMERDVGAPWYMPTRVLQIVPGADYGWRRGTGRWPAYYADTLPSVIDIGLSSPTAVFFGYGAKFPAPDHDALFICDWSYGRIIAVRMKPHGASYTATQENFITGRPLNVTDGAIGPDGALWFTTGGRGTQSGLYRVTHVGVNASNHSAAAQPPPPSPTTSTPKVGVKALADHSPEAQPTPKQPQPPDPFTLHAARLALESQITSTTHNSPLTTDTLLPLARVGSDPDRARVIDHILSFPITDPLTTLRILEIAISRSASPPSPETQARLRALLDPLYPAATQPLNHQLAKHLIYLRSTTVLPKTIALLEKATTSEDLLYYPFILRYLKDAPGWTESHYRTVFESLAKAEKLNGASTYFKALADTRAELATSVPPAIATRLASVITPPQPAALTPHALPGHTFKAWTLADLDPLLEKAATGRSYASAKTALVSTQCVFCHRVSAANDLPAGLLGPDLTKVSARFGRRDLLDHILNPSKVIDEKFRLLTLTQKDGTTITGALESEEDERLTLKPNPLAPATIEIGKSMIQTRTESTVSPMPAGLLNGLKAPQILDLLLWFEAQGNPTHPAFQ